MTICKFFIYQVSLHVKLARVLGSNKVVEGFNSVMWAKIELGATQLGRVVN
jgi:hypothetical protein